MDAEDGGTIVLWARHARPSTCWFRVQGLGFRVQGLGGHERAAAWNSLVLGQVEGLQVRRVKRSRFGFGVQGRSWETRPVLGSFEGLGLGSRA